MRQNLHACMCCAIACAAVSCLSLASCGYTQLIRQPRNQPKLPTGPLPDLAITRVESYAYDQRVSDAPPQPTMEFTIHVKNVGRGEFDGSVMLNYADNWRDVEARKYQFARGAAKRRIPSGDSTTIQFEQGYKYPPGAYVHFILRTDAYDPHTFDPVYYFGREPIVEESYENNKFDYVVKQEEQRSRR